MQRDDRIGDQLAGAVVGDLAAALDAHRPRCRARSSSAARGQDVRRVGCCGRGSGRPGARAGAAGRRSGRRPAPRPDGAGARTRRHSRSARATGLEQPLFRPVVVHGRRGGVSRARGEKVCLHRRTIAGSSPKPVRVTRPLADLRRTGAPWRRRPPARRRRRDPSRGCSRRSTSRRVRGRSRPGATSVDQLVPVEAAGHQVVGGGEDRLVEDVEVDVQPDAGRSRRDVVQGGVRGRLGPSRRIAAASASNRPAGAVDRRAARPGPRARRGRGSRGSRSPGRRVDRSGPTRSTHGAARPRAPPRPACRRPRPSASCPRRRNPVAVDVDEPDRPSTSRSAGQRPASSVQQPPSTNGRSPADQVGARRAADDVRVIEDAHRSRRAPSPRRARGRGCARRGRRDPPSRAGRGRPPVGSGDSSVPCGSARPRPTDRSGRRRW